MLLSIARQMFSLPSITLMVVSKPPVHPYPSATSFGAGPNQKVKHTTDNNTLASCLARKPEAAVALGTNLLTSDHYHGNP